MEQDEPGRAYERVMPPRHRPLIPVLIGFASGIALDGALGPALWVWLVLGFVTVLLTMWGVRRGLRPWGHWLLALLVLLPFGGMCHVVRFRHKPAWHLKNLPLEREGLYHLRGKVILEPRLYQRSQPFAVEGQRPSKFWLLRVELEALSGHGQRWQRTAGGLAVFVDGDRPQLNVGDRVSFLARLSKNRRPTNPGERDAALRYERIGSYATASVPSAAALTVISRSRWYSSVPAALGRLRVLLEKRLDRRLAASGRASKSGLIKALLFGQRGALTPKQEELLKESGTFHFLAISGLHVGIFCVFVQCLITLLGMPVRLRPVVTILLIWLYVLFTGCHVSAVRAGWMLSLMLGAPLVQRQRDPLSCLAGAALLILVPWPQQLFSAGFQFTFVAVWAIVCIYPHMEGILWPWQDLLVRAQRPEERTLPADLWLWVRSYLLLACIVWIATAPIRAYHFKLLCFLAPLLNVFVWPMVLLLLLTCFALAVGLLVGGPLAGLLASLAVFFSGNIEYVLEKLQGLPGFGVYMASPPVWWIGLFYAALAVWVLRHRLPGGRKAFIAVALVLGLSYVANDAAARMDRPFRLTVADVGTGQAALLELPPGQVLLFDAGSFSTGRASAVSEMLWAGRIGTINAVVISHLHSDHCSFIPHLHRRFLIRRVVFPKAGKLTPFGSRVREVVRQQGLAVRFLSEGEALTGGGLRCRVLHPNTRFVTDPSLSENEKSLVLRCEYEGLSFLLTGDVETAALKRLCRDLGDQLKADILFVPHHAHYSDALEDFVSLVRPAVALVSGDEDDCDPKTKDMFWYRGVPLWITAREGAIIITLHERKARVVGHKSGRLTEFELRTSPGEDPRR